MKPPIRRIDSYPVPSSGSVASDVEAYVASRVIEVVSDLPQDPVLEVATTPRGDYVEVMIFVGKPKTKARLEKKTEAISQELQAMGIAAAFYVKTWSGVPSNSSPS